MTALRDPLVHFLAFGVLVFVAQGVLGGGADERVIDVTPAVLTSLEKGLEQTLGRAATPEELTVAVDRWLGEEMLVREARARGLHRGDAVIRPRLAQKMAFLLEAREAPAEPGEAQLRLLLDEQREAFRVRGAITLRQLFFGPGPTGHEASRRALDSLQAGASREQIEATASPSPGGPVLRGRSQERLAELFGPAFAAAVAEQAPEQWTQHESTHGWHLTRIEARRAGRLLTFEEARGRLVARWRRERTKEAAAAARSALVEVYEVRGWPR